MARLLSPQEFGAFGLVYVTYLLIMGMLRAYLIDPFAVRNRMVGDDDTVALGRVLGGGASASVFATVALAILIVIVPLGQSTKLAFLAILPFLPVQEILRSALIAGGRPKAAFLSDAGWAAWQALGLGTVAALGNLTAGWVLLTWGTGAAVGAAVGLGNTGVVPVFNNSIQYLKDSAKFGIPWVMDSMLGNGVTQMTAWVIGVVAGLAEVAAYRGALVLLGPATVLIGGVRLVTLPEIARLRQKRPGRLQRAAVVTAAVFALLALAATVPMLLVPQRYGRQLLGETWAGARAILPWALVLRAIASAADGPLLALRAVPDGRATLQVRLFASIGSLAAATIGALLAGALGAAAGLALVAGAALPVWFARLRAVKL